MATFEGAITAREAAGETQRTEIRTIRAATIEAAQLSGTIARHHRAVRDGPDQPDHVARGRARHRHRRGDRDRRRVVVPARLVAAGPGLAPDRGAQRLCGPPLVSCRRGLRRVGGDYGGARRVRGATEGPPGAHRDTRVAAGGVRRPAGLEGGRPVAGPARVPRRLRADAERPTLGGSGEAARLGGTPAQWQNACHAAASVPAGTRPRHGVTSRRISRRMPCRTRRPEGRRAVHRLLRAGGGRQPGPHRRVPHAAAVPAARPHAGGPRSFLPRPEGPPDHRAASSRPRWCRITTAPRSRRARWPAGGSKSCGWPTRWTPSSCKSRDRAGCGCRTGAWCASPMPARTVGPTCRSAGCWPTGAR